MESTACTPIRPGGRREPLQYDPKGYFVISIDRDEEQIVLQRYLPTHTPAHQMRGRVSEAMLLGLLRENLISQLSHAGYIGGELAKAEAALHLNLRYRQDRHLSAIPAPSSGAADTPDTPADKPRISPAFSLQQFDAAGVEDRFDVVVHANEQQRDGEFSGMLLEPDVASPFNTFHRTDCTLHVRWTAKTGFAMGEPSDVIAGGIFRVNGTRDSSSLIHASFIVVLSSVATIQ